MSETEHLRILTSACCTSHQCEKAIAAMEQLLVSNPAAAAIHYQLGICYSGACRSHSLIIPDFAIEHFRSALRHAGPSAAPVKRAQILDALGNAYTYSRAIAPKARVLAAIECARRAADLYLAAGRLDDWARAENNLGLSNCELAEKGLPEKWKDAIDHFENALCIRRREREPEQYAATLQNLGTAYRALPEGDRAGNIRKAIGCYRCALQIYSARIFPLENAGLHNNLGNAFLTLPGMSQPAKNRHIRLALRHFERALKTRTRADHPCDYAETQLNRGQALLALKDGNEQSHSKQAMACFQEAALCFHKCGNDANAAVAQQRLRWATGCLAEIQMADEPAA